MTSTTGSAPPLHRKYKREHSLKIIRNRYLGLKGKMDAQIRLLQANEEFLDRCSKLYSEGYKDWHILSAIFNHMMALEAERRGMKLESKADCEEYQKLPNQLKSSIFPAELFDGERWARAFVMHAMACLRTYGFEERTSVVHPDVLVRFLRERMNHFGLDLPHAPMFGRPPGTWPRL